MPAWVLPALLAAGGGIAAGIGDDDNETTQSGTTKGKKKNKNRSTSTTTPWAPAAPAWNTAVTGAMDAFGQTNNQAYTGDFVAPQNQMQIQALADMMAASGGLGRGGEDLRTLGIDTITGKYLHPESNPYLSGAMDLATKPIWEKFAFDLLPGAQDQAISQGAYGGDRQGLTMEAIMEMFAREAGDTRQQMAFNNYNTERNRQMAGGNLIGQADQFAMAPSMAAMAGGNIQQGWDQAALTNDMQQFQESMIAPWRGMEQLMAVLGGTNQFNTGMTTGTSTDTYNGTTTGTTTPPGTGGWQDALQGAFSGGLLGLQGLEFLKPKPMTGAVGMY